MKKDATTWGRVRAAQKTDESGLVGDCQGCVLTLAFLLVMPSNLHAEMHTDRSQYCSARRSCGYPPQTGHGDLHEPHIGLASRKRNLLGFY